MKISYELSPQEPFENLEINKNLENPTNNYDIMATPKRCDIVTSQTPVVSMTTRLIV